MVRLPPSLALAAAVCLAFRKLCVERSQRSVDFFCISAENRDLCCRAMS